MPKLEPASIYLTLFASETGPQIYRWAIFASNSGGGTGKLFRAEGNPSRELSSLVFNSKEYDLLGDPRLFLLLKLGGLDERFKIDELDKILEKVAIPHPDDEYFQYFDGRTWVIKAIMRLSAYGIIKSRRVEMMEDKIQDIAAQAFDVHEQGRGWTLSKFE
ncbi:hypothetical protein JB92DRAFT_3142110 [Gautieria morchelliformis]|nr:hypothetical protein JB92DRAFT_3142110 [Gautieria morchelliformis]